MDSVYIEFNSDNGLAFFQERLGERFKTHEVKIETLKMMSLSDLDYCISRNVFIDLVDIHELFEDYTWSKDGKDKPRKARNESR